MRRAATIAACVGAALAAIGALAVPAQAAAPALSPASHDFGTLQLDEPAEQTFTLTSDGDFVGPIAVSGGDVEIVSTNCPENGPVPNEGCDVTVRYAPASPGLLDAELTTTINVDIAVVVTVPLTGEAAEQTGASSQAWARRSTRTKSGGRKAGRHTSGRREFDGRNARRRSGQRRRSTRSAGRRRRSTKGAPGRYRLRLIVSTPDGQRQEANLSLRLARGEQDRSRSRTRSRRARE